MPLRTARLISNSLLTLQVFSSGVFELKIHSFHTAHRICRRHRDCHIFFRICLKHPEDVISAEPPCTFGTGHTNVIRADHTSISSSAPIRVPFHFKWPVSNLDIMLQLHKYTKLIVELKTLLGSCFFTYYMWFLCFRERFHWSLKLGTLNLQQNTQVAYFLQACSWL